ncbi:hypothetical protein PG993_010866 [Apiospora rasikravindrae]|uniref:Uncharacterized protein n=1 Tax=Apiospora rasikravindrae TaxID=990691 RepID=A0ABR1SCN5_9PEZI
MCSPAHPLRITWIESGGIRTPAIAEPVVGAVPDQLGAPKGSPETRPPDHQDTLHEGAAVVAEDAQALRARGDEREELIPGEAAHDLELEFRRQALEGAAHSGHYFHDLGRRWVIGHVAGPRVWGAGHGGHSPSLGGLGKQWVLHRLLLSDLGGTDRGRLNKG